MKRDLKCYKNLVRSSLYEYASKKSYLSPEDEWIQDKIQHLSETLERSVERADNLIILVLGQPSSGKTYLVRRSIDNIIQKNGKQGTDQATNHTHVVELCAYDYKDDVKCMRELLNQLEMLVGSNSDPNEYLLVSQIQNRILHCLKLIKRNKSYLIVVIEGFEVFTKGMYDCSSTTGSCSRRQGLLYFLSDSMQLKETPFTVIFVTSDLNCLDRMEKRVKSRFVYEPVHCFSNYDVTEYFDDLGESKKVLSNCLVKVDKEKMASIARESLCGRDRNHLSVDASTSILMLKEDHFKIRKDKREPMIEVTLKKEPREDRLMFEHLTTPDHLVLVGLSRLHIKGVYPQTLKGIIKDLEQMVAYFPEEKNSVPSEKALRRVFLELVNMGLIEWVNYSENNIDEVKIEHSVNDPSGYSMPCRFPKYRECVLDSSSSFRYMKLELKDVIPTHLSQWLSMASRML